MGRRLELLTIADSETLTYNVTPGYGGGSIQHRPYSRSSTPDPGLVLDLNNNNNNSNNNNKEAEMVMGERGVREMRERKGRSARDGREIPEREVFERAEPRVRRKVSRVESLKRILFNRSETEEKKRRSKSSAPRWTRAAARTWTMTCTRPGPAAWTSAARSGSSTA